MTGSEMSEALKGYPGDLRVVVNGYEEGYDDVSPKRISVKRIRLNTGGEWWRGQHEDADNDSSHPSSLSDTVEALVIRRIASN